MFASIVLPHCASFPPNPKVAPQASRLYHSGTYLDFWTLFRHETIEIPPVGDVTKTPPGMEGDHSTVAFSAWEI